MLFKCKLFIYSNCAHLQQIYAGFNLLFKKKYVDLEIDTSEYSIENVMPILKMLLNDKYFVYYDANDGYNFSNESLSENINIFNSYLNEADYFFKRSCSSEINCLSNYSDKIFPLGLNYGFDIDFKDLFIQRSLKKSISDMSLQIIRNIKHSNLLNKLLCRNDLYVKQESIECVPYINNIPKVLFIARLWDPETVSNPSLKDEWKAINNMRIECVKYLKKEFKNNYMGGVIEDSFSKKQCKTYIIPSKYTKRFNFIKLMHKSDICIATTGLHNSIGWKFAEYVASSKAIVSEPLCYELPGNFNKDENYCEFKNPEECVSSVSKLLSDNLLRIKMMRNNYHYYNNFVRSDNLVLNSIYTVIENEIRKSNTLLT